jgi:3-deoxy-D-manno-octulosonate 8-phosphate phosphatase (KDO 8-P phosphatase)
MAVADAVEEVRAEAAYVTTLRGGDGAVREAVEHLLKARDRWHEAVSFFG